jgi:hypothetical protein
MPIDYSKLSDEELDKLVEQKKMSEYEKMSDEELDLLVRKKQEKEDSWGEAAKTLGKGIAETAGEGLSLAGAVLDYPIAPARELLGTSIEALIGKKQPSDIFEATTTPIFEGPSKSRSWSTILEDLGVPREAGPAVPVGVEQLMTEEEKAAAPQFMPSAVGGAFLEQLSPMALGKVASKIPTPSISRPELMAKAIGMPASEVDIALKKSPESLKSLETLSEYAKESGVVKPFSNVRNIRDAAEKKLNDVGSKIGKIIDNASSQVESWIEKAPRQEREAYLNSGFNIQKQGPRMLKELSDELEGGGSHYSALRELKKWLEKHDTPTNFRPSVEQMQKWKKNVQDSIKNFEQIGAQQPGKQSAYKKILEYLNKGLEAEVSFAEKYLKNPVDLEEYRKLKKEYYLTSNIYENASSKVSKEIAGELPKPETTLGAIKEMIISPRVTSTLAVSPQVNLIPSKLSPAMQFRAGYVTTSPEYQQAEQTVSMMLMQGVPGFVLDEQVRKSPLKPTEKAQLRKSITEGQ